MQAFPINIGKETVTAYIDGAPYTVQKSEKLVQALQSGDWEAVSNIMRPALPIAQTIEKALGAFGEINVLQGHCNYRGVNISNALVDRVISLARDGLPFASVARCLNRLMKQDDARVINSFAEYLERWHIPLKEDGRLVMCKGVTSNYLDTHTGKCDWTPRAIADAKNAPFNPPRLLDWDEVDRNAENACSRGYHAAPLEGARDYARGGRLIAVYLCPSDIAAFPIDYKTSGKLRARYLEPAYEISPEIAARYGHALIDPVAE